MSRDLFAVTVNQLCTVMSLTFCSRLDCSPCSCVIEDSSTFGQQKDRIAAIAALPKALLLGLLVVVFLCFVFFFLFFSSFFFSFVYQQTCAPAEWAVHSFSYTTCWLSELTQLINKSVLIAIYSFTRKKGSNWTVEG